jgi:ribokinase
MHNLGGNGLNSAVAFSRLGLRTGYIGKIGADATGKMIVQALKKEKIDFLGARGEQSGFSIVLDSIEEDRTLLVYKGCGNDLRFSELKKARLKTRWFYLSSMLGESLSTLQKIVRYANENKIRISFNPSQTLLEQHTKEAIDLLRYAEVLILNKAEAETLVGEGAPEVIIKKLLVYGPKVVVITNGKKGAVAYNEGYFYRAPITPGLKVVETTGAGDAFASTLTAGLILRKPLVYCLKMAMNNAESVICYHGAQNLLLNRRRLFELVKNDKRKVEKRKA